MAALSVLVRRRPAVALGIWLASVALLPSASVGGAAELRGRLTLLSKQGDRPSRTAQVREAVVYFEPEAGAPPAAGLYTLATRNKQFTPRLLVVGVGSRVQFPNQDPILHNVFSVSGDNRFDLGLYRRGPGREWTFEHPGLVRVYCNVHKSMAAYVLVLDTPHYAVPDSSGRFVLDQLPAGPGRLTVWHERAEPLVLEVVAGEQAGEQALALRITKPRVPAHDNKHGRPYERRRGEYR